jgi:hypothetical protein
MMEADNASHTYCTMAALSKLMVAPTPGKGSPLLHLIGSAVNPRDLVLLVWQDPTGVYSSSDCGIAMQITPGKGR